MNKWKNFEFGVIWMDIQHLQLLEQIEELNKAVDLGGDKAKFFETVAFIERHINDHFPIEEAYMSKLNYPGAQPHIEEHKIFAAEFRNFKRNCIFREGHSSKELLQQMGKWVLNHLPTNHKALAKFLTLNGCR